MNKKAEIDFMIYNIKKDEWTWISEIKNSFFVRGLPVGAERATGYLHHAVFSRGSEF